jgi:glyoxylase-like metal-dependent hydrolase (beta-lactamase superfamily II)
MPNRPDPVIPVPEDGWDHRIRVFRYGSVADCFGVVTLRYVVLIDTLGSPAAAGDVLTHLRPDLAGRSLLVVNTHGDWDHAWGNPLFAGPNAKHPAPIIGSRLTADLMRSEDAREFLKAFTARHPGRLPGAALVPPTVQLEGGGRVEGGDLTLELLPTPGHTPDHLSVWIPEIRTLLPGDAAEAPLPWVSDGLSLPRLRDSLRRLAALQPLVALYCHAPGISDPGLIDRNLAYFDELEARCRAAGLAALSDDPAKTLLWSLEDAVRDLLPPESERDFYRNAHNAAITAMVQWLNL